MMSTHNITVTCPIHDSFRVQQVAGMFDVPLAQRASETFSVDVPSLDEPWTIGVIVGPSGSGKSTIARAAFGDSLYTPRPWPRDRAVIDGFGAPRIAQGMQVAEPFHVALAPSRHAVAQPVFLRFSG